MLLNHSLERDKATERGVLLLKDLSVALNSVTLST